MTKTKFQPPLRLRKDTDNIFMWPADVPVPTLDENLQHPLVFHTIGDDFVRSIGGLLVREEGDELLCFGERTLTVGHLPVGGRFSGRVSVENKNIGGTTWRIKVKLPDARVATFDVIKCKN